MHRFLVHQSPLPRSGSLELPESESQHAARILRLRPGDTAEILNGRGDVAQATFLELDRKRCQVEIVSVSHRAPWTPSITLVVGLSKGKSWDWLLQKATELGANRIVPIAADHSVVAIDPDDFTHKQKQWVATTVEAAKQCGTPWLPVIECPVKLSGFLASLDSPWIGFHGSLEPSAPPFQSALDESRLHPDQECVVFVGPEGDFSRAEYEVLGKSESHAVNLGPRVLRVETAAIAMISAIRIRTAS